MTNTLAMNEDAVTDTSSAPLPDVRITYQVDEPPFPTQATEILMSTSIDFSFAEGVHRPTNVEEYNRLSTILNAAQDAVNKWRTSQSTMRLFGSSEPWTGTRDGVVDWDNWATHCESMVQHDILPEVESAMSALQWNVSVKCQQGAAVDSLRPVFLILIDYDGTNEADWVAESVQRLSQSYPLPPDTSPTPMSHDCTDRSPSPSLDPIQPLEGAWNPTVYEGTRSDDEKTMGGFMILSQQLLRDEESLRDYARDIGCKCLEGEDHFVTDGIPAVRFGESAHGIRPVSQAPPSPSPFAEDDESWIHS